MRYGYGIAAAALMSAASAGANVPDCKYIALGWEFNVATPAILLDHAEAYDATALDGIGFKLRLTRPDGTLLSSREIWTDPAWTRADVEPLDAPLRELTKHRAFRETLLASVKSPYRRVSWYDDETWARLANNLRQIAWLAKQGGARGFYVDPEDYKYQDQFRREGNEPPYAELAAVARRRGREVFGAMFAEFPDPVVLGFWLFSFQGKAAATPDGERLLAEMGDLWCPFLNGMLDVAPPGARFVDGNEDSYHFDPLQHHFARNAQRQSERLLTVVAPENRDKYRAQMLPGAALYMDMYTSTNPAGKYYRGPLDGTRVRRFEQDLAAATGASGGYVWLWGETHPWVNWKPSARQMRTVSKETWADCVPGLDLAMRAVKNPYTLCRDRGDELVRRYGGANLIADAVCAGKVCESWQDKRFRMGTFDLDRTVGEDDSSSLCATGVGNGCFTLDFSGLRGGDYYEVAASVRGAACLEVKWMAPVRSRAGKFDRELNFAHVPIEGTDVAAWRRARTFVRVPDGAVGASFVLGVHQAEGEKTHFDNLVFRKVLDFGTIRQ